MIPETADATPLPTTAAGRRGQRYHAAMAAITRRLPFGLSRIVAPSFLGFAIINGFTFSVDLGVLALCHSVLTWPYPAAVTVSYLTAFALSFVLNRAFNFSSHGNVGQQTTKYAVATGINYAAFVLGVGSGLTAAGVNYQLARVLSGLCEGAFMYSVMRWVVFTDAPASAGAEPARPAPRTSDGVQARHDPSPRDPDNRRLPARDSAAATLPAASNPAATITEPASGTPPT
jgi:putative flippase GtrA